MSREGYVVLAALLTPEEAGMAHRLLVTEGIEALLEDQALSAVDPLVRLAIGGTKLLVPAGDAGRARALVDELGLPGLAGARQGEDVEIPEAEWSAQPPEAPTGAAADLRWSGPGMLFAIAVLIAAAYALLDEARRPHWPPWSP